ncbi:MAG: hypothetical protein HRU75_09940 [Planctomycetia bacterium]|nr:MAG: hypothetical protein HRU75_09940 [Planctomycetia bacterium]
MLRQTLRCCIAAAIAAAAGCSHVENQWREDGPSVYAAWESPTEAELRAGGDPAAPRARDWPALVTHAADGRVSHFPLHFEDPLEDRGVEALSSREEYALGWEDLVAAPWSYGRHWLNIAAYPVSLIVTPPWTLMESDGRLSRQALGYDHDATRADPWEARVPPPGLARREAAPNPE